MYLYIKTFVVYLKYIQFLVGNYISVSLREKSMSLLRRFKIWSVIEALCDFVFCFSIN